MAYANPADRADYYRRVETHRNGGHLPTVLAHVRLLRESGMSLPRVAEVSGVSYLAVRGLWHATSTRVTRSVADRILAVEPGDVGDGALVPRDEADRLLSILTDRGWTPAQIGVEFGYQAGVEFRVQRRQVKMGTIRRLRALLDKLPPGVTAEEIEQRDAHRARNLRYQHKSRQRRGVDVAALRVDGPRSEEAWREEALCRGKTAVFFSAERRDVHRAKAICERCSVSAECLSWALATKTVDDHLGVCAGTTEEERVRMRRKASA